MSSHVSLDEYFLQMLRLVASRGTCRRRQVAAIISDQRGVVLAMGYNGVPRHRDHCIDTPCEGANDQPGNSDRCLAIHAEVNAVMQCADLIRAFNIYVTCVPCFSCAKMIANTGIKRVVCLEDYADTRGKDVLMKSGIQLFVAHAG
jgi:dCMP deaminase